MIDDASELVRVLFQQIIKLEMLREIEGSYALKKKDFFLKIEQDDFI